MLALDAFFFNYVGQNSALGIGVSVVYGVNDSGFALRYLWPKPATNHSLQAASILPIKLENHGATMPPPAALDHLTVVDLTRILAGPWASQTLADLGAEVIKIEHPKSGDDTRSWGPPFLQDTQPLDGMSAYFCAANRNKKSIALDFASEQGAKILRQLIMKADVVIENYKVGGLKKYGLDYDTLKNEHPGLIYCSITGFGQSGPYAHRAGYDFIIQAMSGLMSVTGQPPNTPGDEPMKIGVALTDIMTGLYASTAILAAVAHREKSGHGQHIDMSLMDVSVAAMANQTMNYLVSGTSPSRMGNSHPNIVPYQVFPTADGHLIIAVGNDRQFQSLMQVLGEPSIATDARYTTNNKRVENREHLVPALTALTSTQTTSHWAKALDAAQVPYGPINDTEAVFNDPQVIARELAVELEHPTYGAVPGVACPVRLSETPARYQNAPPSLGADTVSVLKQHLHLTDDECTRLIADGICKTAAST